jgi:hypothetical protein
MRGARFVHAEAEHPVLDAVAREGDAVSVPAVPGEDVAYEDALTGRPSD